MDRHLFPPDIKQNCANLPKPFVVQYFVYENIICAISGRQCYADDIFRQGRFLSYPSRRMYKIRPIKIELKIEIL